MSVVATIAAMQAKNRTIVGMTSAPDARPASLNTAELPMALTNMYSGSFGYHATGLPRHQPLYRVVFYVAPAAQGQGVDQGWQKAIAIFDAAYEVWKDSSDTTAAANTLGGVVEQWGSVMDGVSITHQGIQVLEYGSAPGQPGASYWGFVLNIFTVEKA